MSWSVGAIGKPEAVNAKLRRDLGNIHCSEPEESVKTLAAATIVTALAAFPDGQAVKVTANGSQSTDPRYGEGKAINSLFIQIEPLWGFCE